MWHIYNITLCCLKPKSQMDPNVLDTLCPLCNQSPEKGAPETSPISCSAVVLQFGQKDWTPNRSYMYTNRGPIQRNHIHLNK